MNYPDLCLYTKDTTLIVTVVPYWIQTPREITQSSYKYIFAIFQRGHPLRQRKLELCHPERWAVPQEAPAGTIPYTVCDVCPPTCARASTATTGT